MGFVLNIVLHWKKVNRHKYVDLIRTTSISDHHTIHISPQSSKFKPSPTEVVEEKFPLVTLCAPKNATSVQECPLKG